MSRWTTFAWRALRLRLGVPGLAALALAGGLGAMEVYRVRVVEPHLVQTQAELGEAMQEPWPRALSVVAAPAPTVPELLTRAHVPQVVAELHRLADLVHVEWAHTDLTQAPPSPQAPAHLVITQSGRMTYPVARAYIAMVLNSQPQVALTQVDLRRVSTDQTDAEIALRWVLYLQPTP